MKQLRRKRVLERMVVAVIALYVGVSHVNTAAGTVGVHKGSVLSLLLFITVMDEPMRKARKGVPWELVQAYDLILMTDLGKEVLVAFERWIEGMEMSTETEF